jgi:hypothetical protein
VFGSTDDAAFEEIGAGGNAMICNARMCANILESGAVTLTFRSRTGSLVKLHGLNELTFEEDVGDVYRFRPGVLVMTIILCVEVLLLGVSSMKYLEGVHMVVFRTALYSKVSRFVVDCKSNALL